MSLDAGGAGSAQQSRAKPATCSLEQLDGLVCSNLPSIDSSVGRARRYVVAPVGANEVLQIPLTHWQWTVAACLRPDARFDRVDHEVRVPQL